MAFGILGILICLIIYLFIFFDIVFFIDVNVIASLTKWAGRDLNVICYISLFYEI